MSVLFRIALVFSLWLAPLVAAAQTLGGQTLGVRASVVADLTETERVWGGAELRLGLSQPVPFRAHTLDNPRRLVLDFREVDFDTVPREVLRAALVDDRRVYDMTAGPYRAGWSRMELYLLAPLAIQTAALQTDVEGGPAVLQVMLERVEAEDFAARSGPALSTLFPEEDDTLAVTLPPEAPRRGLRILLDPGHGGVDPGAVVGEFHEADLVLAFARQARDVLRRRGHEVIMSRDEDVFVSLEGRIVAARDAGADLMISIHADALAEGIATGAQIYTLSDEASSRATQLLAERHSRDDLLAGNDLSAQDDSVATALMEIARRETAPRGDALADALVDSFKASGVTLHKRPREEAAFAVLKAPDMPAVLLELGFMSSPEDLARLLDAGWRGRTAEALAAGVDSWRARDATLRALRRR